MPESSDAESPTPEWTQGQELSRALGGDGKEERGRVDLSILPVLGQQLKVSSGSSAKCSGNNFKRVAM